VEGGLRGGSQPLLLGHLMSESGHRQHIVELTFLHFRFALEIIRREGEYDYEDTALSADKGNRNFVDQSWLSLFFILWLEHRVGVRKRNTHAVSTLVGDREVVLNFGSAVEAAYGAEHKESGKKKRRRRKYGAALDGTSYEIRVVSKKQKLKHKEV
jgi:hypothetical protein